MLKIKEIDLILGNNEKNSIVDMVEKKLKDKEITYKITDISEQKEFLDFGITEYNEKTRAVIKVEDGCNNFCTYCIIPYTKGRVRSRKVENVLQEIKQIVQKGIQEVVITGIHVASYGKDLEENIALIDLLEKINEIDGLKRIRLGSLEPKVITKDFVERLKNVNKMCDHFHLSLQSGCDETLKRMNRKYTCKEFEEATELLKNVFPKVALTTDIIVGFPGETEEEFNITYKFLGKIDFAKMHIFRYSQRKGTIATTMKEQISSAIKEKRSNKLLELSSKNEKNFLHKFIGKEIEVLFEEKEGEYYKGHTSNYLMVKAKTDKNLQNIIKKVKIMKEEDMQLIGNVI